MKFLRNSLWICLNLLLVGTLAQVAYTHPVPPIESWRR